MGHVYNYFFRSKTEEERNGWISAMKSLLPTTDHQVDIKELDKLDEDTLDEIVNISNPFKDVNAKFTEFQNQFKGFPSKLKNLGSKKNPDFVPEISLKSEDQVREQDNGKSEDEVIVDLDMSEEEMTTAAETAMVPPSSVGMDKGVSNDDDYLA
jgi:hypothetical protein